ncbi:MAG TPA: DUF6265 family protein [Planctomycetota bacterium]|nr:DUF6265 family protein [Planctomycetota bacterium]
MKLHRLAALCALTVPLAALAAPVLGRAVATTVQARTDADDGLAAAPTRSRAQIGELGWLAGQWTGKGLGGDVEQHWTKAVGGSMAGMFRLVQNGAAGFYEFLLIEQGDKGITLRFQHFNPGYAPWEKNGPLVLDLVEASPGRAVFQSRDPKQSPARVIYMLHDDSNLGVMIESPEGLGGAISFEVLYERVRE